MENKFMKVARFPSVGASLEIATVPIPIPGPQQVLIKVYACGICHGDFVAKYAAMPGVVFPRIPGHEVAGVIEEVGEGVTTFKKGDRVGVGFCGGSCSECHNCRRGEPCPQTAHCGISYDGGFAEYMVNHVSGLARIPDDIEFKYAAPLMCAGLTTFNALRNLNLKPGDIVAVQGIGGLGHLAIQYARRLGYNVYAISSGKQKEELAKSLGAHVYIDASTTDPVQELLKVGGAKVIMATAPNASVVEPLMAALGEEGIMLIIAALDKAISVNTLPMLMKRQSLLGWRSGDWKDCEDTLKFSKLAEIYPMVETFPLEKAQEAFDKMSNASVKFRSVLVMHQ